MNTLLPSSYAPALVALSFLIAAVGAFVALTAASGIARAGRVSLFNALASGTALGGVGVWAMHFVGMLSMRIDMAVSYSLPETAASLLVAIAGSALALLWVARRPDSVARLLGGGMVLGAAVCAMHYLGMYGMRFEGFFVWSWPLVALSMVIAAVAATAALWLAFAVRTLAARVAASGVMAGAVCAMHYTGMEAAGIVCTTATPWQFPAGDWLLSSLDLPVLVSIAAFGMAFVIFVDQMFQRMAPRRAASRTQSYRSASGSVASSS
jgi:NO-binding membrane sensor protein with MHYT domain